MTSLRKTMTLLILGCSTFAFGCQEARQRAEQEKVTLEKQQVAEKERGRLLDARSDNLSLALNALDQGDPEAALGFLEQIKQVDSRFEGLYDARMRALAMQEEAKIGRQEVNLLSKVATLSSSDVRELRGLYFKLWRLRPDNEEYKAKYNAYLSKATALDEREDVVPSWAQLKIEQWSWGRDHGYLTVDGRIKNLTRQRLSNIEAVVEFSTRSGEFVKSATALVEYNPVMPGQTSPFRIMTPDNPEIRTARISFKNFGGAELKSYQRR